jgi:peptide/nickel transport system substrate-binding protein
LSFRIPWPVSRIDPHALDDIGAALFGPALFNSLYRATSSGFEPELAETEPAPHGSKWRVRLREGITTGNGTALVARDVVASIDRARARGASGWLANIGKPRATAEHEVEFAAASDKDLMAALSSPLVATVARDFRPDAPDGTGPFRLALARGEATFRRNPNAAEGPSFLDEMHVTGSAEVAASLRAFESGKDDLGWLGKGLYEGRRGARVVDAGSLGWVLLATGKEAGSWDTPGAAQALADAVSYPSMAHLKLGSPWTEGGAQRWRGPPCELLLVDDCPWLLEVGKTLAALVGTVGHEVVAKAVSRQEFTARRRSRGFALALGVVRAASATSFGVYAALASANDPSTSGTLCKRPPLGTRPARAHGRFFRVGVVGEVRAEFGCAGHLRVDPDPAGGVAWGNAKLEAPGH